VITFAPTSTPPQIRLAQAVAEMRDRLAGRPPTRELYRELAERYEVTTDELGQAWIRAGLEG
jgi:hypothetical protein